jgi:hypothetical protein
VRFEAADVEAGAELGSAWAKVASQPNPEKLRTKRRKLRKRIITVKIK